jgi:hypothetical protein
MAHVTASNINIQRSANWLIETPCRQQFPNLFNRGEADVVIHSRKCLTHVEGFPAPIKVAVVVGSKRGVGSKLAGEQSAGQRHTRQNTNALFFGSCEEDVRGTLPEAIEYDLHRLQG